MEKTSTAGEPSTIIKRTVLHRRPNAELRPREYLTEREVERLIEAARKHGRHGHRNATAILVAYRHGLRATELCDLEWSQVELDSGRIHIRRSKNGTDSTHPLTGKEIRALRQLRRDNLQSRYVFNTERGAPVTRASVWSPSFPFRSIRTCCAMPAATRWLTKARHPSATGYLGHKNIQHTVRYTELTPMRFKDFWRR